MTSHTDNDWVEEFGIDRNSYPLFFRSQRDIGPTSPQAHTMRHAFSLLELDGVLCSESAPLIYFKRVEAFSAEEIWQLNRKFWNHGGAPILVLIAADAIQVYTGMSRPTAKNDLQDELPSFVAQIGRVTLALREFLISVETGAFFRDHSRSFDPAQRVDRDLLNNLRDARNALAGDAQPYVEPAILDGLLCRLVFACYLFDRRVVVEAYLADLGIEGATHLRDILAIRPASSAKAALYRLFSKLGSDFNGDLFSDDLDDETRVITDTHILVLSDFFHGTQVKTRQTAFWPYDFGSIPIETVSAIYEHFLKDEDHDDGAFYTPRFLAEIVLDAALRRFPTLLGKTFLDPACGSGIFLVGLFNRIAEEWKKANPDARNDTRARELMRLLQESLFGIDTNPTACRITAFSLYLAYLDQLAPRDIQELQRKGRALPRLIRFAEISTVESSGNITCLDFFEQVGNDLRVVDLVIGNPPWGSIAGEETPAGRWCQDNRRPLPDKQIATAFIWKALEHVAQGGPICLVLPHGVLFNHGPRAINFQRAWVAEATLERVLNLADFRWFLFGTAVHPALVVNFVRAKPSLENHVIEYWVPKTDWAVTQVEIIPLSPFDRKRIPLSDLLRDLDGADAPQIWTRDFWGTPRDLRLLDRLSSHPRLRDRVRQPKDTASHKPWVMAEGFQPVGKSDNPAKAKTLPLPSRNFIPAKSRDIDLFLLRRSCVQLPKAQVQVREKSNKNTQVFMAPHVLVSEGFTNVAFANFHVSFQDALRGIHGPEKDSDLLAFLAAYLRSSLAKYYLFHTSSNWGIARPVVRVQELQRLPLPLPEHLPDSERAWAIVRQVARLIHDTSQEAEANLLRRSYLVDAATARIEPLIDEYFGIHPLERILIDDTLAVTIPSIQPTPQRMPVPTVDTPSSDQQEAYLRQVCDTLSAWAKPTGHAVRGSLRVSMKLGVGIAVLEKSPGAGSDAPPPTLDETLVAALGRLRSALTPEQNTVAPVRGLMLFRGNLLYLIKPSAYRYWTQSAALNDADEIAGTILMHPMREIA
jgi:hypothetical protein